MKSFHSHVYFKRSILPTSSFNPFSFVCHSTVSGCPETASVAGPEHLRQSIPGEKERKGPTKGPSGPAHLFVQGKDLARQYFNPPL